MNGKKPQSAPKPVATVPSLSYGDAAAFAGEVSRVAQVPRRESRVPIDEWIQGELAAPRLPTGKGMELGPGALRRELAAPEEISEEQAPGERTAHAGRPGAPPRRLRARQVTSSEEVITVRLEESAKKMLREAAERVNAPSDVHSEAGEVQSELRHVLLGAEMRDGFEPALAHVVFTDTGRLRRRRLLLTLAALAALGGLAASTLGRSPGKSTDKGRAVLSSRAGAETPSLTVIPQMQLEISPAAQVPSPEAEPTEPAAEPANSPSEE